jgi:hypothetical protein
MSHAVDWAARARAALVGTSVSRDNPDDSPDDMPDDTPDEFMRDVREFADLIESIEQPTASQPQSQPASASTSTWSSLMQKLDCKGPLNKKFQRQDVIANNKRKKMEKEEAKKRKAKGLVDPSPSSVETEYKPPPPRKHLNILPYFDPWIHGYYIIGMDLVYKHPDGTYYPATGVDSFGPFTDKPLEDQPKTFNKRF